MYVDVVSKIDLGRVGDGLWFLAKNRIVKIYINELWLFVSDVREVLTTQRELNVRHSHNET